MAPRSNGSEAGEDNEFQNIRFQNMGVLLESFNLKGQEAKKLKV